MNKLSDDANNWLSSLFHTSRETYKVNSTGNQMKLLLDITTSDGTHFVMTKYLERIHDGVQYDLVKLTEHVKTMVRLQITEYMV